MNEFLDTTALIVMAVAFTWLIWKDTLGNAKLRARIEKMLDELEQEKRA